MKTIPSHIRNINGITPVEKVPFIIEGEQDKIRQGLVEKTSARLAVADVVRLRLMPVAEEHMPKLTVREHGKVSDFARWFMTLGRGATVEIQTEALNDLECARCDDDSAWPKLPLAQSANRYLYFPPQRKQLTRATVAIDAIGTIPEYDDITVRVLAPTAMLSAPNSQLELSGEHGFNMAYLTEVEK